MEGMSKSKAAALLPSLLLLGAPEAAYASGLRYHPHPGHRRYAAPDAFEGVLAAICGGFGGIVMAACLFAGAAEMVFAGCDNAQQRRRGFLLLGAAWTLFLIRAVSRGTAASGLYEAELAAALSISMGTLLLGLPCMVFGRYLRVPAGTFLTHCGILWKSEGSPEAGARLRFMLFYAASLLFFWNSYCGAAACLLLGACGGDEKAGGSRLFESSVYLAVMFFGVITSVIMIDAWPLR